MMVIHIHNLICQIPCNMGAETSLSKNSSQEENCSQNQKNQFKIGNVTNIRAA